MKLYNDKPLQNYLKRLWENHSWEIVILLTAIGILICFLGFAIK